MGTDAGFCPSSSEWFRVQLVAFSKKWLQLCTRKAWTFTIAQNCSHRKDFDLAQTDERLVRTLLEKRSETERNTLQAYHTGAAFTHDFVSKYNNQCNPLCPLCQLDNDSCKRRMFKCPALSEVRARHKDLPTWLPKSDETTQKLALSPDYKDALRIKVAFELPWELARFFQTNGRNKLFVSSWLRQFPKVHGALFGSRCSG